MHSHLERLQQELETALRGAAPEALANGPAGKWTPAQILEHLQLTYRGTNKGIAKCLENGAPLASPGTFKDRVRAFAVIKLEYFPSGRKSPERAVPKGLPVEQVHAGIFDELRTMDAGLAECERRFGTNKKILDHPVLGPLNVQQWRRFHWVHGRHHAKQIWERLGR